MAEIDRRTFLATGSLALAGLAAACSSKKGPKAPGPNAGINDIITIAEENGSKRLQMIQAAENIPIGPNARIPFALISGNGATRLTGGRIRVWYAQNPDAPGAGGPVEAVYHGEGLDSKGVYVVRANLDKVGTWIVFALGQPEQASGELFGGAAFTAVDRVAGPAVGAKAISVATPTPGNHRGVEPYCTSSPACSLHAISLDAALASGKPTVFNIGTPKFCSSQVCGPVVDVIETAGKDFVGRVHFVHAEVYKDDRDAVANQILSPTAKAYSLESEPITYWIKADGSITERIVGPVDVAEVRDLTQALLG